MAEVKRDKKYWIGRILIGVLLFIFFWSYYLMEENYTKLEMTNQVIENLYQKSAVKTQEYASQVIKLKQEAAENLRQLAENEKLVSQLRDDNMRIQQERQDLQAQNAQLQEKVKLLDKMAELEAGIASLKEKNSTLMKDIERLEKEAFYPDRVKSLVEGKEMKSRIRQKVRSLDLRMRTLTREAFAAKVEAQKEIDRQRSIAGNNGFVMRNGMIMPQDIILTTKDANIKVDVEFVK